MQSAMTIKAALFDFDGTLADTAPDMAAALNKMRVARKMPPLPVAELRGFVSGGARALLRGGGINGDKNPDELRAEFLSHYEETGYHQTALFPGVDKMLGELERLGLRWGVVTNKPSRYFLPIADMLGLSGRASCLISGDTCARAKPHPDSLLYAAKVAGSDASDCLYAGDDMRDAIAATAAGMPFVVAAWGYWQWNEEWDSSARTNAIISAPTDLFAAIKYLDARAKDSEKA